MIESYSGSETLNFGDARHSVRSSPPPGPGPQTPPSSPGQPPFTQDDVIALNKLRKFALYNILAIVFAFMSVFGVLLMVGFAFGVGAFLGSPGLVNLTDILALGGLVTAVVVMVVSTVLVIVLSVLSIVNLRSAFKILKSISPEFNTPYLGANLVVLSLVLTIVAAVALVVFVVMSATSGADQNAGGSPDATSAAALGALGFDIAIFALGIMGFVGEILALTVGGFKLKDRYGIGGFSTAGILYVLGIVTLGITSIIAYVMYYTSSKKALEIVKSRLVP
jgi:hypothetical protein